MTPKPNKPDYKGFALAVLSECVETHDINNIFVEYLAEMFGLLKEMTVNEPCGEECECADMGNDFPTTCLRIVDDE